MRILELVNDLHVRRILPYLHPVPKALILWA
jgi:hypothetical protein